MGAFINVLVVQNRSGEAVRNALETLGDNPAWNLIPGQCRYQERGGGVSVLLSDMCSGYDAMTQELSKELACPVMLCYIYDGDFWGYFFFDSGEHLDAFMPMPYYFEEMPEEALQETLEEMLTDLDGLLNDFNRELTDYLSEWEFDEEEYYQIEKRLDLINHLKAKYGNSVEAIQKYQEKQEQRLKKLQSYEEYKQALEQKLQGQKERLDQQCRILTKYRREYARKLERKIQEQLTDQIADAVMDILGPRAVLVMIEAEHMCMTMRGIKKPGSRTVTISTRGCAEEDPELKQEFFSLVRQ